MSPRGIIIEVICRSSSRNTLRTIWCSCASITPASRPSSRLAAISSSVTLRFGPSLMPSRLSTVWVDQDRSRTKGRAMKDSHSIGGATRRATDSGYIWPRRLGTSSPKMMVRKVMITTTKAVPAMSAARSDMPSACEPRCRRLGERGLADDAVEDADRGDADLHRGKELGGVLVQVHRGLGAGLAGFDHHLQPDLAGRGQRHFGHGEGAIEQDQEDQ